MARYPRDTVMTHMVAMTAVICAGIALAVWGQLISISWPDVLALIIWITGIAMLAGIALMSRYHTTVEP